MVIHAQYNYEDLIKYPHTTYEEHGAVGDGKHDDTDAIRATHEYANAHGLYVIGKPGATYLTAKPQVADIKTSCYWKDCTFIIDDTAESVAQAPRTPVFAVHATVGEYNGETRYFKGQICKGYKTPYKDATLVIKDHSQVHFKRFGECANPGAPAMVTVTTDMYGCIEQTIMPTINRVDDVIVHEGEKDNLFLYGGTFITIANQGPSMYKYYQRGIKVFRSNVTISNIEHKVINEGLSGAPYESFITIAGCKNVTFINSKIQARKFYYEGARPGERSGNPMGTYEIQINEVVNIRLEGIIQTNFGKEISKVTWGPIATNYCNTVVVNNCVLDRFDAHNGITNFYIYKTTIGWQGIKFTGWGSCFIEGCKICDTSFIVLRYDYGAFWDGNIYILDCEWAWPEDNLNTPCLISALNYGMHDFGYPCMGPYKVRIENLTTPGDYYVFSNYNDDPEENQPYPYVPTSELVIEKSQKSHIKICPDESKPLYSKLKVKYID